MFSLLGRFRWLFALSFAVLLAACDSIEDRVAEHYERGVELAAEGEIEKAMLEFRNAIKLNPDFVAAHFAMGEIHEARGEAQSAFGRFRRVAELDPTNIEARIRNGNYYMVAGNLPKAREEMEAAVANDPENIRVMALQAGVELRSGNLELVRDLLDKAIAKDPEDTGVAMVEVSYLLETGDNNSALNRLEGALAQAPDNDLLNLLKLRILNALGDETAMIKQLERLIELDIQTMPSRKRIFNYALQRKDMDLAERELQHIVRAELDKRETVLRYVRFIHAKKGADGVVVELNKLIEETEESTELELMLAEFLEGAGRRDEGVKILTDMIERGGDNANKARIAYTRILFRTDRYDEAMELAREVLASDENNVDALVLFTQDLLKQDRVEEAIQTVRRGLNEAPNDVRLLLLAGRAQELSGNIDLANDRFARAVRNTEYQPQNVLTYVQFLSRLRRFNAVETVLTEALRRNPESTLIAEQLGFSRIRLENWAGVEQVARLLERQDKSSAERLRAASLVAQEKFVEGSELIRELADNNPSARTMTALIASLLSAGDTEAAVEYLDEQIADNAENLQALGLRGNLFLAQGKIAEARDYYNRILAIDPTNPGAHSSIMRTHELEGDSEGAMAALEYGLELAPDSMSLLTRLAQLREIEGKIEEAIDIYDRLYKRAPNSQLVINNLASLLSDFESSDPQKIDRAYKLAGRLRESDLPHYQDTYAWTRYLKGEYDEAARSIRVAIEGLPDNHLVQFHAGMIFAAQGDAERAITHLETALSMAGDRAFPAKALAESKLAELKES